MKNSRGHRHDHASLEEIQGWFAGRLPDGLYVGAVDVSTDRDEILVIGTIAEPDLAADASSEARAAAVASRIAGFREDTRGKRMQIADEAQHRFAKAVSWGARCADQQVLFTTLSVPAMTRLRMPERKVLDTLVEAGVARSRSHALAWCVRWSPSVRTTGSVTCRKPSRRWRRCGPRGRATSARR